MGRPDRGPVAKLRRSSSSREAKVPGCGRTGVASGWSRAHGTAQTPHLPGGREGNPFHEIVLADRLKFGDAGGFAFAVRKGIPVSPSRVEERRSDRSDALRVEPEGAPPQVARPPVLGGLASRVAATLAGIEDVSTLHKCEGGRFSRPRANFLDGGRPHGVHADHCGAPHAVAHN